MKMTFFIDCYSDISFLGGQLQQLCKKQFVNKTFWGSWNKMFVL